MIGLAIFVGGMLYLVFPGWVGTRTWTFYLSRKSGEPAPIRPFFSYVAGVILALCGLVIMVWNFLA